MLKEAFKPSIIIEKGVTFYEDSYFFSRSCLMCRSHICTESTQREVILKPQQVNKLKRFVASNPFSPVSRLINQGSALNLRLLA